MERNSGKNAMWKLIRDFINFLKNEKCYVQFRHNVQKLNNKESFFYLNDFEPCDKEYMIVQLRLILIKAFVWTNTKEGNDFWTQLHEKWEKHIDEHYQ